MIFEKSACMHECSMENFPAVSTKVANGYSIKKDHCTISKSEGEIILFPMENAKIKVNGETLTGPFAIKHKDRVLFGLNHLYVFYNPLDKSTRETTPQGNIDWEFASLELTKEQGMAWDAENMNRG